MPLRELLDFTKWAVVIEFLGALVISFAALRAFWVLLTPGNRSRSRRLIIEGSLSGLSFKVAASLLKTIDLHSFHQILLFSAILALRTILKADFAQQMK